MKRWLALSPALLLFTHLLSSQSLVDRIGIPVEGNSREFSYTNKQAGTYSGEVNGNNSGGWQGWFVNAAKILHDYRLEIDGTTVDRMTASSIVYPHQLVRKYPTGLRESFTLLDSVNAFVVEVEQPNDSAAIFAMKLELSDAYLSLPDSDGIALWQRVPPPIDPAVPSWIGLTRVGGPDRFLFVVVAGSSKPEVVALTKEVGRRPASFISFRKERMEQVLRRSAVTTGDNDFNTALMWAKLSLDALIMNQSQSGKAVKGIYAGLPWFNNYWGRDSFISLPGATLVTGDFADAREILLSFARFQSHDSSSTNFGRIPNIVTPSSIAYNTADGTPWFVKELYEYVKYSGDTSILPEIFPVVERSIEGTIRYHTDSLGFLTHGDAETWMDAAGPDGPWSPRGNRACEVQALWYDQLLIGSFIAEYLTEYHLAARWSALADTLQKNFNRYFVDRARGLVYDHLKKDGAPSTELRPNQLFCLDLVNSEDLREQMVKSVTSRLIYSHGVGTLASTDSNFHPYHHAEPLYVQDAAYHNGIVWTWLDGRALYALTRNDEEDLAYELTKNLVDQILHRGCVGTLSEVMDAMPRDGEKQPRLSGTFSQAWSLAEFIRSFYQDYLGISADATAHTLRVNPKLPHALGSVSFKLRAADAEISGRYTVAGDSVCTTLYSQQLSQSYNIRYLWVYRNGDAAYLNATLVASETLAIDHTLDSLSVSLGGRDIPIPQGSVPWHLKNFSSKGFFRGLVFAHPAFDPKIPALRGPGYPLLSLEEMRAENPRSQLLFDKDDAVGDDTGITGTYRYPASPLFKPGILDITHATVRYDSANVYFRLRFRNLTNPGWHPEYGYQLTLAAIAVHRGDEGARDVGENSFFTLADSLRYDRLITVGGGVRVSDDKGKILCEYLPRAGDERNPIGNVGAKSIEFSLPLRYLGMPTAKWKMTVLVGAQDDHGGAGIGEFRAVESSAEEWIGGGKILPTDPNVYDTLVLEP